MPLIRRGRTALSVGVALGLWLTVVPSAQRGGFGQQPNPAVEPMRFRYMGPPSAGRISAVAGIPGDTRIYYAGAASGGVWKTTDGGTTFAPIFDEQTSQAIGALAVAPSDPNIVWAGTGEAWVIRPSDVMGDGIYKSVDAGTTWKKAGLPETGRIGRILVHPTNPQIVYACALGRATGPQQERGVYRTTNGGETWDRVLFVNPETGCSGISMDARDPNVLIAGTWQVVVHTWAMFSGGEGSGVYITRDGGATWKKAEAGLPKPPVGKIDVAIAPSDSKRMFCAHPDAQSGVTLAIGRCGRDMARRELGSHAHRPGGVLHQDHGESHERRRGARRQQYLPSIDGRRADIPDRGRRVRRLSRHLDGSEECRSLGRDR
jgi:photosystem II stability/assembly factor-like uncharacterized protein